MIRRESDLIVRELAVPGDEEYPEDRHWGTVRVTGNGMLEVWKESLLLYAASLEHFAFSILWTWPPQREPSPPPGKRAVRTTFADGRVVYTLENEP